MNQKFGNKLKSFAERLHLRELCSNVGIEQFVYRRCYKNLMEESAEFFDENKMRVDNNLALFKDELSKEVYRKAIWYRRRHYLRDRPPLCKKQYFNDITPINEKEVFVDGGGFDGDSVLAFLAATNGNYKKIVSFEPDPVNYEAEKRNLAQYKNCVVLPYGLWNCTTQLHFKNDMEMSSRVDEESSDGTVIEVVAIDQMEDCKDATFIKMDIEGSELMALEGARETILRNRPILTVCIYHSDEDMLAIPEWMNKNLSDYRYYCRHHSLYGWDTVMYAIPKERLCRKGVNNGKI
jgi:FkbM family methyltransferase